MAKSIRDILKPLGPYWDRIVRSPCSKSDVKRIEKSVGREMPTLLRDLLLEIGLFQDLTYENSSIELFDDPEDFDFNRQFIDTLNIPRSEHFFPFGHDGSGNIFAMSVMERKVPYIYFIDHDRRKVVRKHPFTDWVEQVVTRALRGIKRRPTNEQKAWYVQFTFEGVVINELLNVMSEAGAVRTIDGRWKRGETTRGGVTESSRRIEFEGDMLTVGRLECQDWESPLLSFDMHEPIARIMRRSRIRALNALFKRRFRGYKLVNYGPLNAAD